MLTKKTKLELTWIGKENRPRLEPRILLEDQTLSHHAVHRITDNDLFDNRLIFGDNLLALKALEQEFSGKIKCIYIDPPFNTGEALDHYDDGVEHSLWLTLMRERLVVLHRLLCTDGLLWIHLDNTELHYCKVLLDEIFGRDNFVSQITYERSGTAGIGQGGAIVNVAEYILCYRKEQLDAKDIRVYAELDESVMKRYNKILMDIGYRDPILQFRSKSNNEIVKLYLHKNPVIKKISLRRFVERREEIYQEYQRYFPKIFRTTNPQKENTFQNELISNMDKDYLYSVDYIPSRGKRQGQEVTLYYLNKELVAWLSDTASLIDGHIAKEAKLSDVWSHADIPKADLANEGGVEFKRGKKPENLLKRIIEFSSDKGDWVLDSFAGSGTTGAVAHKMGRRWIMVELGEHCHTHIIPRLQKVIDGTDQGGISKAVGWKGGGGFRYFRLAPSLLEQDKWGNWVINKQYNAAMLAEAMCKHMGFTYAPSDSVYWQHGHSTERDFIYVTTQNLNQDQLTSLSDEVGGERTLLVCCTAFRAKPDVFPNLTLQKIPKAVLNRCEWGRDDYSLQIADLPPASFEETVPPDNGKKSRAVKTKEPQQEELPLFEKASSK